MDFVFNLSGDQEYKEIKKSIRHSFGEIGQLVVCQAATLMQLLSEEAPNFPLPGAETAKEPAACPVRSLPACRPAVGVGQGESNEIQQGPV